MNVEKNMLKNFAALRAAFFFKENRNYVGFTVLQAPQAKKIGFRVSNNQNPMFFVVILSDFLPK